MAKKETKKVEIEIPQTEEKVVTKEPQVVKQQKTVVKEKSLATPRETWEVKDRTYHLKGKTPLSKSIKGSGVYYFDEEKGYERELKYTSNQKTCFVDEMIGDQRLEHIIFRAGVLNVPKNKVVLQKLLSLYHPHKDKLFYEWTPEEDAKDELDWLEFETEALVAAKNLDIDMAEAVMRAEKGSSVSKMTSKELKRDCLLFARRNPFLFLELANDENLNIRNVGIKATEQGIIKLSNDQRTFMWGSTDRKLIKVPFDENPYSALAAYFKTDDGIEVFQNIEKKLK